VSLITPRVRRVEMRRSAVSVAFGEVENRFHVEDRQDPLVEPVISTGQPRPRRIDVRRRRDFGALLAGNDIADIIDDQGEILAAFDNLRFSDTAATMRPRRLTRPSTSAGPSGTGVNPSMRKIVCTLSTGRPNISTPSITVKQRHSV
jgi:hypothetical protein